MPKRSLDDAGVAAAPAVQGDGPAKKQRRDGEDPAVVHEKKRMAEQRRRAERKEKRKQKKLRKHPEPTEPRPKKEKKEEKYKRGKAQRMAKKQFKEMKDNYEQDRQAREAFVAKLRAEEEEQKEAETKGTEGEPIVNADTAEDTPMAEADEAELVVEDEPKAKKVKKEKKEKAKKDKSKKKGKSDIDKSEKVKSDDESKDESNNDESSTALEESKESSTETSTESKDKTSSEPKEKAKGKSKKDKSDKKKVKGDKAEVNGHDETPAEPLTNGHSTETEPTNGVANGTGYVELSALAKLPQSEIDGYLSKQFISITDPLSSRALRPIIDFAYLTFADEAQREPFKSFKAPTPIQAAAWPHLLNGRDLIGVAETGSGKTMAFSLPCVRHIAALSKGKKQKGVKAVIVCPTRELAMQGYEQIDRLAKTAGLKSVCIYGGVPKDEQRAALKTSDIVVATPGRLNDLIDEGCADLSKASFVVLDEADRMLDKGFEEDIKKIIGQTMPLGKRQTVMFTATWPESVRSLASTFMSSPVKILIGDNPDGDLRANTRIVQKVEVVQQYEKEQRLLQLLKQHQQGKQKDDRILVFCLYKKEAMRVEGFIRSRGISVAGIHGDMSQDQRTRSLESFKSGKVPVLVATDVAARGLDIPAVKLVINCTFPLTVEDYVHRIGRTGRAGKDGLAITLFTEHDKAHSGALINILKAANQNVPEDLLKFGTTVKKKGHEAYGAFFKDVDTTKKATKITFD